MIYKRGEIYWYEFRIAKIRHRGSTGLKNKRAAQEFHDDLKARKKREAKGLDVTITNDHQFYAIVEKYLAHSKIHLRASTVKTKTYTWDMLKIVLKDKPLGAICEDDVKAVREYGVATNIKNATINIRVSELRAFTRWAKAEKYLSQNPLAEIKKLPVPKPTDKLISDSDCDRLMDICPTYLKEIIWVDWQTGMRLANVVTLRYNQIDFESGGIAFTPANMKKGEAVLIDLEPELIEWFRKRREAHPTDIHVWPSPYWAAEGQDRPRHPGGVSFDFTKSVRKLGIDATFHSIRHTFATRWAKSGVSLFMVGKFLSHKSPQSTQRYVHVADLASQKEAKKRVVKTNAPRLPRLKVVG